jgi:hypothetical protein
MPSLRGILHFVLVEIDVDKLVPHLVPLVQQQGQLWRISEEVSISVNLNCG